MDPKDHDLLIQIATKVDRLILDVKEMKDDTAKRVEKLESEKVEQATFATAQKEHHEIHEEHTRQLNFLMSVYWKAIGGFVFIQAIFGLVASYILKRIS